MNRRNKRIAEWTEEHLKFQESVPVNKLYVSAFEYYGKNKYGLFNGSVDTKNLYTEDFKPLVFDTEKAAVEKLSLLESERRREEQAVPFTIEEAKKYAESHYWKFASTYAKTAPHEYCMKKWLVEEDKLLYERFVATIRAHSVVGYFYGHKNDYLILGDHYYWYMPHPDNLAVDLINRTTTDYLEYRDGAYYYIEKKSSQ